MDPAQKKVLSAQAISEFEKLDRRLRSMSLIIPQSPDLATTQAKAIADVAYRLIDAISHIRISAQHEAEQRQNNVDIKVRELNTRAGRIVQRILDNDVLESSRTVKANFRLIFGPVNDKPYTPTGSQHRKMNRQERIDVLRNLSKSYPHGVVAFSVAHSTKVWVDSSLEVFNGLLNSIHSEPEHSWPEELLGIMDELENERPMTEDFKCLRTVFQCKPRQTTVSTYTQVLQASYNSYVEPSNIECPAAQVHAGEVYALTEDDLREIACSGQIGGEIVLTIPLAINTPPFVNVLVSNQLSRKFSRTRGPPTMMHHWRTLLRNVWWKK